MWCLCNVWVGLSLAPVEKNNKWKLCRTKHFVCTFPRLGRLLEKLDFLGKFFC